MNGNFDNQSWKRKLLYRNGSKKKEFCQITNTHDGILVMSLTCVSCQKAKTWPNQNSIYCWGKPYILSE